MPATLPSYTEEMAHDGGVHAVTVENFEVQRCENCGAMIFDDAANDRLGAALREVLGLFSPEEIRAHRTALGLSQQAMADLMCVAVATISRWENGGQIQQRSMNRLLKILFDYPEVRAAFSPISRAVESPPTSRNPTPRPSLDVATADARRARRP